MSANKIDVEKKRAEEKKLLSVMIEYTAVVITAAMMGIKKNCAIPAKNWRNMRFSGQKNAHLWKQRLFAVPVRFTVMQKNSGNRFVQSCVMQDRG